MHNLQRFEPHELCLTQHEAWKVLVFFFDGNAGTVPGWLTDDDRSFAQALLIESITASSRVGIIRRLWESTVMPPVTITSFIGKLAIAGLKIAWDQRGAKSNDPTKMKIYKMVRSEIARQYGRVWGDRLATDEPVLY